MHKIDLINKKISLSKILPQSSFLKISAKLLVSNKKPNGLPSNFHQTEKQFVQKLVTPMF